MARDTDGIGEGGRPGAFLRIPLGPDIAVGPGKADLLEGIRETGSIAAAGRRMGMSYKRAWMLVETMNRCFEAPLVETSRGGREQGGARLTEGGARVLALYRAMQEKTQHAVAADMEAMRAMLRDPADRGDMSERK
ncbi:winged helix-turn-helix domain-containing protein [Salinarimonas rosea]|uniref:winged helix-turn-helix domain-containing protein n=1 Tax=Salinarimonas rosea TaxID=552063 RepID=UPI000426B7CF|nr:winged helix-turn-helix domain-containing protein [Salinarimonas rosea]